MKMLKTLTLTALLAACATSAFAGSYSGTCTKEAQAKWMPAKDIEAKAIALGYAVSKSKVAGSCYEVYATKAGARAELFFNPMTGELVHSQSK
jgi:hypothetical protein